MFFLDEDVRKEYIINYLKNRIENRNTPQNNRNFKWTKQGMDKIDKIATDYINGKPYSHPYNTAYLNDVMWNDLKRMFDDGVKEYERPRF